MSGSAYSIDFDELPMAVEVVDGPVANVENDAGIITEVLHDSERRTRRPSRMASDVWGYYREFMQEGGLLDYAEEIASLAELEVHARSQTEIDADLIMRIVDKRSRIKDRHLAAQLKRHNILTMDSFRAFLDGLFEILSEELDPGTMQSIGYKMQRLVKAIRAGQQQ